MCTGIHVKEHIVSRSSLCIQSRRVVMHIWRKSGQVLQMDRALLCLESQQPARAGIEAAEVGDWTSVDCGFPTRRRSRRHHKATGRERKVAVISQWREMLNRVFWKGISSTPTSPGKRSTIHHRGWNWLGNVCYQATTDEQMCANCSGRVTSARVVGRYICQCCQWIKRYDCVLRCNISILSSVAN